MKYLFELREHPQNFVLFFWHFFVLFFKFEPLEIIKRWMAWFLKNKILKNKNI